MTLKSYYRGYEVLLAQAGRGDLQPYVDSIDFIIFKDDMVKKPVLLRPIFLN
ncbi:hypothetical protein HN803_07565 [candidate division WWE3 bacterium]|jgi:hypothetical protein|nr:hypothetical protein [candidate division WWE3 bacterium]